MFHELGGGGCKRDFDMKRVLCWCCCLCFFLTKTERERCGKSSGMLHTSSVVPRSPDEITAQVRGGHKNHPGSAFSGQLRRYQAPTRRKRTKEPPFLQSHKNSPGSCRRWGWDPCSPPLPGEAFFEKRIAPIIGYYGMCFLFVPIAVNFSDPSPKPLPASI